MEDQLPIEGAFVEGAGKLPVVVGGVRNQRRVGAAERHFQEPGLGLSSEGSFLVGSPKNRWPPVFQPSGAICVQAKPPKRATYADTVVVHIFVWWFRLVVWVGWSEA